MATVEESLSGCMSESFCGADKMFGKLTKVRRDNIRDPQRPARQQSAEAQYVPIRRQMAAEGQDALINSPHIGPGINELTNATVGTGRRLKPLFNQKRLGWTDEQYTDVVEDAKCLFNEDMNSKRKYIDQEGNKTLPEMERQVLEQTIVAGECYTTGFWFTDESRPFRTALAIIENDRIRNPVNMDGFTEEQKCRIVAGHFNGPSGRTSSYFIHDYHRNDPRNTDSPEKFTRVRRYNEFGREQVIHSYRQKMPGMTRGLSDLTAAFSKMKCLEQYQKSKLEAAIMQVAMAVVVKSNDKNILSQLGSGSMVDEHNIKKIYTETLKHALTSATQSQESLNDANFNVDGVKAIRLLDNEDAEILTANTAATNDKQFIDDCHSVIGRHTGGMSKATLTQDFEASYSAARATLISFYRQCENMGHYIVDDWLQSVYAMWLEDVIESGRLAIPNYPDPADAWMHFTLNREWYCNAAFNGPARDEIDQAKTATAAKIDQEIGGFCYQDYFDKHKGMDYKDAFKQQFEELKEWNAHLMKCGYEKLSKKEAMAWLRPKFSLLANAQEDQAQQEIINSNE